MENYFLTQGSKNTMFLFSLCVVLTVMESEWPSVFSVRHSYQTSIMLRLQQWFPLGITVKLDWEVEQYPPLSPLEIHYLKMSRPSFSKNGYRVPRLDISLQVHETWTLWSGLETEGPYWFMSYLRSTHTTHLPARTQSHTYPLFVCCCIVAVASVFCLRCSFCLTLFIFCIYNPSPPRPHRRPLSFARQSL